MNQYEMIVLIVIAAIVAKVIRDRHRLRFTAAPPPTSADTDALIAEVARLRERVAVLERIATDGPRRLSDEIETLRSHDDAPVR